MKIESKVMPRYENSIITNNILNDKKVTNIELTDNIIKKNSTNFFILHPPFCNLES